MEKKMNFGMNAAEVYEVPVCEVLELQTEGVLCLSWPNEDGNAEPSNQALNEMYYDEEE